MRVAYRKPPSNAFHCCTAVIQSVAKGKAMPSENEQLVGRVFLELWNYGKLAVADEIFAANYVNHDPASPDFRNRIRRGFGLVAIHIGCQSAIE